MDASTTESLGTMFRKHVLTIVLTAFIPVISGAAYLTGLAFYRAYLHEFHIPASLVPISTAVHFVYAHRTISYLGWSVFENWMVVFAIVGIIFLIPFQWLLMESLSVKIRRSRLARYGRRRFLRGEVNRAIRRILFLPAALTLIFSYLVIFLLVLLIIPEKIGSLAGKSLASQDLVAFSKGCNVPNSIRFCNNIFENKDLLGRGYIVGSSEKNIIIYDGKKTVVLPRGDKTIISTLVGS
jgi:hypothetical protein